MNVCWVKSLSEYWLDKTAVSKTTCHVGVTAGEEARTLNSTWWRLLLLVKLATSYSRYALKLNSRSTLYNAHAIDRCPRIAIKHYFFNCYPTNTGRQSSYRRHAPLHYASRDGPVDEDRFEAHRESTRSPFRVSGAIYRLTEQYFWANHSTTSHQQFMLSLVWSDL